MTQIVEYHNCPWEGTVHVEGNEQVISIFHTAHGEQHPQTPILGIRPIVNMTSYSKYD